MKNEIKQVSPETVERLLTDWKNVPAETQWAVLGYVQAVMTMSKPVAEPEKQPA